MKNIFLHSAVDLLLFVLFIVILCTNTQFLTLAWLVNTIFLVCMALIFVYDIAILGDKIEKYINRNEYNKNKEN